MAERRKRKMMLYVLPNLPREGLIYRTTLARNLPNWSCALAMIWESFGLGPKAKESNSLMDLLPERL